jgi:dolichol-phosphate mannosyltransferase
MKDIILLPTYNERRNIEPIISQIFNLHPEIYILVIDDNSPDRTAEAVKQFMKKYPHLSLLERQKKTGLGDAYKDAISRVILDEEVKSIITMDADGSHDPEYLKELLSQSNDYDLVIGSRYIKGGGVENWEFWRRYLSKFGNLYSKILTGLKISDLTAGFMCINRKTLEKVDLTKIGSTGYSFLIELKFYLIKKCQVRAVELPIIFKSRRGGESKLSNQIIGEGLKTPLRIFFRKIWKQL